MRDRGRKNVVWRAAVLAIAAGLIVAYVEPVPSIDRDAATGGFDLSNTVHRFAGLMHGDARTLAGRLDPIDAQIVR